MVQIRGRGHLLYPMARGNYELPLVLQGIGCPAYMAGPRPLDCKVLILTVELKL